ncbi:hypothetical protein [Niabella beijingensis]|uniref:hypothetical protein n=1 Tax=Niabella beijingensis TaxID=2872700 RepID=UPI001CBB2D0D|nr:hypothetical protein [Niabella beijingensis]MBZ4189050.1 hypothetical protein [Niabella beijingensis]
MAATHFIKETLKQDRLNKPVLLMLVVLWMVSLTLILWLLFSWRQQQQAELYSRGHRKLSLDDMLLSFNELKLGNNTTLINLQLKEISQKKNNTDTTDKEIIADNRKKIYDRMLEEVIRSRPPVKQEGFTIKPVPQ